MVCLSSSLVAEGEQELSTDLLGQGYTEHHCTIIIRASFLAKQRMKGFSRSPLRLIPGLQNLYCDALPGKIHHLDILFDDLTLGFHITLLKKMLI